MASRYHWLALYSLILAAATGWWLSGSLAGATDFPPAWVVAALVAACLFVWQFGIRVPRVGLSSMERVPQVGMLLVLSPPVAAAICAAASLLWPLISRRYSHGSPRSAVLRAVHNAAMTALMLLLGGRVYLATGGRHPLTVPTLEDLWPLVAMAITAQLVNVSLLALYFRLDGREVRRIIRPVYTLVDLVFVPAGVLAAVLFNTAAPTTFALFVVLMVLFVLSFNGIGSALPAADAESSPLARLSRTGRVLHGARRIDELGEFSRKRVPCSASTSSTWYWWIVSSGSSICACMNGAANGCRCGANRWNPACSAGSSSMPRQSWSRTGPGPRRRCASARK